MKRLLSISAIAALAIAASAQEFNVGTTKASLSVGVGVYNSADKPRATFDQHLNMEWGIGQITDKLTIGVGFAINNAFGGSHESAVVGSYNYTYNVTVSSKTLNSHNRWVGSTDNETRRRKGQGYAQCNAAAEHYNAMATVAVHCTPMSRLDAYVKLGVGAGAMSTILTNYHDEQGFSKDTYKKTTETKTKVWTTRYSYNDLDHAEWDDCETKVTPAVAFYVGATYYITEQIGLDAQFGLVSSNIKDAKKAYPSSFSILAIGAAYRF